MVINNIIDTLKYQFLLEINIKLIGLRYFLKKLDKYCNIIFFFDIITLGDIEWNIK